MKNKSYGGHFDLALINRLVQNHLRGKRAKRRATQKAGKPPSPRRPDTPAPGGSRLKRA
jgi:hypothetical protein